MYLKSFCAIKKNEMAFGPSREIIYRDTSLGCRMRVIFFNRIKISRFRIYNLRLFEAL